MDLWADLCWDLSTSDNDRVVHFCFFWVFFWFFFPFRKYFLQRTGLWCSSTHSPPSWSSLCGEQRTTPELGSAFPQLCSSQEQNVQLHCHSHRAVPPPTAGKGSLSSSSFSSQSGHFSKCDFKGKRSGGCSSFSCGVLRRVISDWAVTMEDFMLGKLRTIEMNLKPVNPLCRGQDKKLASHHSSQHSLTSLRFCSVTYEWKAPWAIWASVVHPFCQLAVFK